MLKNDTCLKEVCALVYVFFSCPELHIPQAHCQSEELWTGHVEF